MKSQCILMTGGSGQLGETLKRQWPGPLGENTRLYCPDRKTLDITRPDSIDACLQTQEFTAIINAAAYTAVDKAEQEPEQASAVNARGPAHLARLAKQYQLPLLHISTDFVFDGNKKSPYQPGDPTAPLGVYGRSKLEGEQAVLDTLGDDAVVIRTSWLYSAFGHNFVKTMLRLMGERDSLRVVNDQIGSPTSTHSLAQVILAILGEGKISGIYHWCDGGEISWFDFAVAIQAEALARQLIDRKIPIAPISSAEYPTPARRPAYSVLDVTATRKVVDCPEQNWLLRLREVMGQIRERQK